MLLNRAVHLFLPILFIIFTECVFAISLKNKKELFLSPEDDIQEALDAAVPGQTIYLKGGSYYQKLKFKKSGDLKNGPIVLTSAPGEKAIIDGGQTPPEDTQDQLVLIKNKSFITISNIEFRNFHQAVVGSTHAAIFISGKGQDITISQNIIHDIKTELPLKGGNAHAIAIYGDRAPESLKNIKIEGNEIYDLKLGSSEAVSVNGNVEKFVITKNYIHDCDNIAIDLIGHEKKSPIENYDQARDGLVSENKIERITSKGNPNYGDSESAGGIYVDGGKNIKIEKNEISDADIGIEIASEHFGRSSSLINVSENRISFSHTTGISIGGYAIERGKTVDCKFSKNILYKNDKYGRGGSEITIQFHAENNQFTGNKITSGSSNTFIYDLDPNNVDKKNIFESNSYQSSNPESASFTWRGVPYFGLEQFQKQTGQDKNSQMVEITSDQ